MANLSTPVGDQLSYNGFTFDSTTSTELTVTPVEDRAKRTHTHYVHELTARMRVAVGNGAVAALARARLNQPAGALVYRGRGVGTHVIGGGVGPPDLMWGPKPGPLRFKPLGGSSAVEMTWSVRWATMTCGDAVYTAAQPMEYCYSIEFDVDYAGLTTRRYTGTLRIPQSRRSQGDRLVQATADQFREAATPAIPPGFRRTTPAQAKVSEDKCELTLTCVDTEFGNNVYPVGVVQADASYSIESEPGRVYSWVARLSATYEIGKGYEVATALNSFFSLLKDKLKDLLSKPELVIPGAAAGIAAGVRNAGGGGAGGGVLGGLFGILNPGGAAATAILSGKAPIAGAGGVLGGALAAATSSERLPNIAAAAVIPWGFSFSEPEIYGRNKVQISCQFKIVGATKELILGSAGLWRPVPDSNWARWITSVPFHQHPRGYAQLVLDPGSDVIHDLCRPAALFPPPEGGDASLSNGIGTTDLRSGRPKKDPDPPSVLKTLTGAAGGVAKGVGAAGKPLELFRIYDENGIQVGTRKRVRTGKLTPVPNSPLLALFPPVSPSASYLDYTCAARVENDSGVVTGVTLPTSPLTPASLTATTGSLASSAGSMFAQQRTVPQTFVVISGYAVRAGYPVPRPELVSVNGATPVACNRLDAGEGFEQMMVSRLDQPIYYAKWTLRYAVPGPLPGGGPPVPPNPYATG